MKKLIPLLFLFPISLFAQDWQQKVDYQLNDDIFCRIPEEMPAFINNSITAMQNEIVYPQDAKEAGKEGKVVIQFTVNEEGNIENATVLTPIFPSLDAEALRIVTKAKFIPGRLAGKIVKVRMLIPIRFRLP